MSILPFIDSNKSDLEVTDQLPLLKEYAYDYAKNELLLDEKGCTYMVEGNEALRIWIMKALSTERFQYIAYSAAFGEEFREQLVGHSINTEVLKLEMERYIIEALMVNPYIKRLDIFVFEKDSFGMVVTFECTSIYGTDNIPVPIREVWI